MAVLNEKEGTIVATCPSCGNSKSTFEWRYNGKELGAITGDYSEYTGSRHQNYNRITTDSSGALDAGLVGLVLLNMLEVQKIIQAPDADL